jgi:hypothetical protein
MFLYKVVYDYIPCGILTTTKLEGSQSYRLHLIFSQTLSDVLKSYFHSTNFNSLVGKKGSSLPVSDSDAVPDPDDLDSDDADVDELDSLSLESRRSKVITASTTSAFAFSFFLCSGDISIIHWIIFAVIAAKLNGSREDLLRT